jgi:hypothetical protein
MSDSTTYTWNIAALEVYATQSGQLDVVYNIHWRYNATTSSYFSEVYGVQQVSPYNPDSGSFIPYNELTENIVIGWLTDAMGQERVNQLTASLDYEIESRIRPTSLILPAPWNIPPTPTPTPTVDPNITPTPTPTLIVPP